MPVAAVGGNGPRWALMGNRQIIAGDAVDVSTGRLPVYAVLQGGASQFEPPYAAYAVQRPDGGTQLFVSAGQNLYAGDVTAVVALPQQPPVPATLTVRNVPFAGGNITSMAGLPPKLLPKGAIASAYVLSTSGLAQVTATSESRYRSSELLLPDGDALEVWVEGDRARVGMVDGRVFSLPSRLLIGDRVPLPGDDEVSDFGQACGQTYALAGAGLYRLAPSSGAVGTWVKEPLVDAFIATLPQGAFSGGKLLVASPDIHLFAGSGVSATLTIQDCPNP